MSLVRLIVAVLFILMAFICALTDGKDIVFNPLTWLVASIAVSLLPVVGEVVVQRK